MKNILIITTASFFIFGCTTRDKKLSRTANDKNEVGVQNPKSNIPDTTNAKILSTH